MQSGNQISNRVSLWLWFLAEFVINCGCNYGIYYLLFIPMGMGLEEYCICALLIDIVYYCALLLVIVIVTPTTTTTTAC